MYGTRVIKTTLSDHYVINTVINSQIKATHKLITCRTYKNFVETSFISELSDAFTDFNINMDSNIDELWQIFKMKFLSVANTHAPYRCFRAKGSSVPWVSHDIVSVIKERDNMHKRAISENDHVLFRQYRSLRNLVTNKIHSKKKEFINDLICSSYSSKNLWRAVSVATGKNIHTDNVPNDLTCDSMNNYFSNIGCELNAQFTNTSATWKGPSSIHTFHFDVITSESVMKHLLGLPNRSNNDILEFDSKLLKLSAHVIYPYLTGLFNLSLQQKLVPVDWKTARVTPVYKGKGSRSESTNFRPIFVICHIAKIFEKCIQSQLLDYLEKYDFISCDQSAFLNKHSTVTAIHKIVDNWIQNIDEGQITCVCFFDIKNALIPLVILFSFQN